MKLKRPSHTLVVAYLALFVAMTGTATAATGGTFILGRTNTSGSMTVLTNTSSGTPLRLNARPGYAPLQVNSQSKVTNLNADKIDGVDSSGFQKKVSGTCTYGISSLNPSGFGSCADGDAASLNGSSASDFAKAKGTPQNFSGYSIVVFGSRCPPGTTNDYILGGLGATDRLLEGFGFFPYKIQLSPSLGRDVLVEDAGTQPMSACKIS